MGSLKASKLGLARIRQAIAQKGWKLEDDRWLVEASTVLEPQGNWQRGGPYAYGCSESTWERFLQGKELIRTRSFEAFCTILGLDAEEISERSHRLREDWGEAPDVPVLYGRERELDTLEQWINGGSVGRNVSQRCRLIAVLGIAGVGKTRLVKGGIGKTDLSLQLARRVQNEFDYVIWRRLLNAPPPETILTNLIEFLSDRQQTQLAKTVEDLVTQLLHYLRQHRCLLILDNVESILCGGDRAGQYRVGFEGYGELFRRVGETSHQSCLLLNSREKPQDVEAMEATYPVRSLELGGLDKSAGQAIFRDVAAAHHVDFQGSDEAWENLIHFYSGNPLALEVVARHILRRFDGNVEAFLDQGLTAFGKIRELLDWHFDRLSKAEQEVMYWLAINREPVSIAELREDIISPLAKKQIPETLDNLERRIPIERSGDRFTLQPVLIEYMTDRFVRQICHELKTQEIDLFNSHTLLKASSKDSVRESQVRLILNVVSQQLAFAPEASSQKYLHQLLQVLLTLKEKFHQRPGYAGGNLLNLLRYAGVDIKGYDFSHLSIWQAYLQGANLHQVNFSHCDFAKSVFTQAFGGVHAIAFSPNGESVAVGDSNGDVRLFRNKDRQQQLILKGHQKSLWITSVAFSPDGEMLISSSFDRTVKLWNTQTGECLRTFTGHTNWVWAVAFSPDGQTIASGGDDQTVRLWNIYTGTHTLLEGHQGWVWSVAFSPDGQTVATGSYDHTIRFWNVHTGKCFKVLIGHESSVWSLAFNSNGDILASGSLDYTVRLWRVDTGECIHTLKGHTKEVRSIAFSSNGQILASGSFDQTIRLWNAQTGEHLKTLKGHANGIRIVAFDPTSQTLASGDNYQVLKLWDVYTGECLKTLQGHTNWMWAIAISPNGKTLASGSLDQLIRLWDIADLESPHQPTEKFPKVLTGHTNWVWSVAFSPDGKTLASASDDETIKLWNVSTGQCLRTLYGHVKGGVWTVTFSSDGKTLASGGQDGTIRFWNVQTGECLRNLQAHCNWVWSIVFSPDGKTLVSGSDDQTIKLWQVQTGECLMTLQVDLGRVMSVAFSPDGKTIASGNDNGEIKLWNAITGKCMRTLQGHTQWVLSVLFSPDGQIIASASADETIKLWDIHSGECVKILQGHTNWVRSLAFAPACQMLVSCGSDGTIQLWDIQTGSRLVTLQPKRPYEGTNLFGATGLTNAQRETLIALGAIASSEANFTL